MAGEAESDGLVCLLMLAPCGAFAGYAWYRWSRPDADASLLGICVGRKYLNRGAGRALMTRLLEIAASVGPPVMRLTMQEANARAFTLYRKMGFDI